jgi:hypothetical protein
MSYAISETYTASGECVQCFKGESAFKGGVGTTGTDNRAVNVRFLTQGKGAFTGADATKISQAVNDASSDWNSRESNGVQTPFDFRAGQDKTPEQTDVAVILVDDNDPALSAAACAGIFVTKNDDGSVKRGYLYVKRSTLNNLSATDLNKIMEHEFGHFMGLADNKDADHCESIMSQTDECKPLGKGVASDDVSRVNKYVADASQCKRTRKKNEHIEDPGGGYIEPPEIPNYYPRTCYYYYDAVDYYQYGDFQGGRRYIGTVYYLTDIICF